MGDMLEHLQFDTIYHEHLSYIGLGPMSRSPAAWPSPGRTRRARRSPRRLNHPAHAAGHRRHPAVRRLAMLAAEIAQKLADPKRLAAFATSSAMEGPF